MPTIICDHCQYVGSGPEYHDRIADVEEHEKTCKENPDYAEEPEIVECEIRTDEYGDLVYKGNTANDINIDSAYHNPDFIGFKYESGQVELTPIVFKNDCSTQSICQFRDLAGLEILHATAVLFRRQK